MRDVVFFSHWLIMRRSRNWTDLRSPARKIRDIQIVGTYDHITFSEFQKVRSSPAALAQRQRRKKVTWRRVIPSDLVTWPWTVGGHRFQTPREIDEWLVDATHFFRYSWKNWGGWYQTPFGARFNFQIKIFTQKAHVSCSEFHQDYKHVISFLERCVESRKIASQKMASSISRYIYKYLFTRNLFLFVVIVFWSRVTTK